MEGKIRWNGTGTKCFSFRRGGIPEKNAEWQRQLLYDDPGLVVEELNLI
jgi:hypothetical protein